MRKSPSLLVIGLLAGAGALQAQTGTGAVPPSSQTIQDAQSKVAQLHQTFDSASATYRSLYERARAVSFDPPGWGNSIRLGPQGAPSAFGDLTYQDMLAYMPVALIDEINRRIYREYLRGYHEWEYVSLPPLRYLQHEPRDIYGRGSWSTVLYTQWDQDVGLFWNIPTSPWGLYIDKVGALGSGGDIASQIRDLSPLADEAGRAIDAASRFQVRTERTGRFISRDRWVNENEWKPLEAAADSAMKRYREALDRIRANVHAECRRVVESVVKYERGRDGLPVIEFLMLAAISGNSGTGNGFEPGYGGLYSSSGTGSGTGDGRGQWWRPNARPPMALRGDSLLDWYFDNYFLMSLPEGYQGVVEKKFAYSYFRGAYDSKYDNRIQGSSGTGSGWNYNWGTSYGSGTGTGDGYSYGGTGSSAGYRRRRGTASSTGNGTGSGTNGTGSGGYPSGSGSTGSGGYPSGSGSTGSGGYPSGSGSTGSGGYPSGSSSTGSGGSPRPSGSSGSTGTGSGSGTSGTGTGSGS